MQVPRRAAGRMLLFISLFALLLGCFPVKALPSAGAAPMDGEGTVQAEFYVSPDGDDSADGSIDSPFRTVDRAKEAVAQINGDMTGDIAVYIRGGEYDVSEAISFGSADSGTNGYDIVYKAYPGETPVISGGREVTGWTQADAGRNIWSADLPDVDGTRQLFIDGAEAVIAKGEVFSSSGWDTVNDPDMSFYHQTETFHSYQGDLNVYEGYQTTAKYKDMASWRNPDHIEFVYDVGWTHDILPVDSITERTDGPGVMIEMKQPAFRDAQIKDGLQIQDPSYIQNAYELMDDPGEWYFDPSLHKIYYIPKSGEDMNAVQAIVPVAENLLLLQGTLDQPVQHLRFEGLHFQYTSFLRPYELGHAEIQANFIKDPDNDLHHTSYVKAPGGIILHAAQNVTIERCEISRFGASGIDIEYGSRDNTVRGSIISEIAGSGVQVGGFLPEDAHPDDLREVVKDNVVTNNLITQIGTDFHGGIGIFAGYTDGTVISHNEVTDTSYTGISVGWGWGLFDEGGRTVDWAANLPKYDEPTVAQNNIVEYNIIHKVMQKLFDGGAIYTLSMMPGTVIRGNLMYNSHGWPLYLDEGSGGIEVTSNIVQDVANAYFYNDTGIPGRQATNNVHDNYFNTRPETAGYPQELADQAGIEAEYADILPTEIQSVDVDPLANPGDELVIRGSGFGTEPGEVTFTGPDGPVRAQAGDIISWSARAVTVTLPEDAVSGPVHVTTADGVSSNGDVRANFMGNPTSVLFEDDFDSYAGGPLPSGHYSIVPGGFNVAAGAGADGSNALSIAGGSGKAYKQANWENSIMSFRFKFQNATDDIQGLYASSYSERPSSAESKYYFSVTPDNGSSVLMIQTYANGQYTMVASADADIEPGAWYTYKTVIAGDSMYAKVWPADQPEPTEWTLSGKIAGLSGGGGLNLEFNGAGSNRVFIDDLLVQGWGDQSGPVESGLYGQAQAIYDNLLNPNGSVMAMAHRGDWKHHPENSLSGVQGSVEGGADIAEMDIRRTSDGHYVLMHDPSVNRTTDGSGNVADLPWSTIRHFHLKMHWGDITGDSANITNETVPELPAIMNAVKGKMLVNLDKMRDLYLEAKGKGLDGFTYWDDVWDILEQTGTTQLAVFKGEVGDIAASEFQRWVTHLRQTYPEASPLYMPIFSQANGTPEQIKTIIDSFAADSQLVKPVAYEVQFNNENASSISAEVIQEVERTGARACVNVMDNGPYNFDSLNAGNNDSAMYSNPDKGYPWVIAHGGSILQTDVAPVLKSYLAGSVESGDSGSSTTQTVVLQQNTGYSGAADTNISQNASFRNHNMGGNDRFEVGTYDRTLAPLPGSQVMDQLQNVTASSENTDGHEVAANLVDQNLGTKWLGFARSAVLTFTFAEPVTLRKYAISSANDSPGRDIANWTLEGSNDGESWTALDTRSGQTFADRFATNSYDFANDDAFTLYRFNVQNNGGDGDTQLAEIQLSDGGSGFPAADNGDWRYGLLRFDLSSIPEGAQITSANLGLYVIGARSRSGKIDSQHIGIHGVSDSWEEGTGTGIDGKEAAGSSAITWDSFMGTTDPFDPIPAVVQLVSSGDVETWKNYDITALVNRWANGDEPNNGMLLKVEDADLGTVSTKQFAASENAIQSLRPKLTVTYAIRVQSVAIAEEGPLSLTVGNSTTLHASVMPAGALDAGVRWSSDNGQVAAVSGDGTVTGLAEGTATIAVTSIDGGKTAAIEVRVSAAADSANLSGMRLSQGTLTPAFSPSVADYTIALPDNGANELTLTPAAENAGASVTMSHNGGEPESANDGDGLTFGLEVGANLFRAVVTSADGAERKTYTFHANKEALFYQNGANGYHDAADAHTIKGASHTNSNTGGHSEFEVGYYDKLVSDAKYGLIRFGNLDALPEGAIVTDAKLHLYLNHIRGRNAGTLVQDTTIELHEITGPWVEGEGTGIDGSARLDDSWVWWSNQPAFDPDPVSETVVGTVPGQWYAWDITSLAQKWAAAPSDNFGMLLKNPDPATDADVIPTTKDFASKENADVSLHPYLTISYVLPSEGVRVTPDELNLAAGGDPARLTAQMVPLNGASEAMTWSTDNEAVATVDSDGTVHPLADGTAIVTVTTDVSGYTASAKVHVHAPGTTAGLRTLALSTGVLDTPFGADVTDYTVYVSRSTATLTLNAAASDPFASVTLTAPDGSLQTLTGGGTFARVALTDAGGTIMIAVRSEDGSAEQTYRLNVRRSAGLSGLTLSAGELTPGFSPETTGYTASVIDSVYSMRVTPTAFDPSASIAVSINGKNAQSVASGKASEPLKLEAGSNVILVQVGAAGSTANPMYTIIVNKPGSGDSGEPDGPDDGSRIRSIAFDATAYSLKVGQSKSTVVRSVYADHAESIATGVTFLSANPAVADIAADGTITGKQAGSAAIFALYEGYHATAQVTVSPAGTPGGDNPGGGSPGGNNPGGNTPGGNNPGGNNPDGNTPGGGVTGAGDSDGDSDGTIDLPAADTAGYISVAIDNAATQVLLRVDDIVDSKSKVLLHNDGLAVQIPGSVLNKLKGQVDAEALKNARIAVRMKRVDASQASALLGKASAQNGAVVTAAGEIVDFSLSITDKNGNQLAYLPTFDEPITLSLKVKAGANADLLGVYSIADEGTLEYIGGKLTDGMMTTEVYQVGKYAVLEYDKSFSDVGASYWAADVIKRMAARHIVNGVSDTAFAPNQSVTRAEFASMLVRALSLTANGSAAFKDVDSGKWYAEPVAAAAEAGIVSGRSADEFAPDAIITREEMAVMLMNAYALSHGHSAFGSEESFSDQPDISAWAREAVLNAKSLGLLSGRGGNRFVPKDTATRAESAQAIANLISE